MTLDLLFNFLWLVPLVAWFATRNKPYIVRSAITGTSLGLVITQFSFGLHALHLAWPISEAFGQFGFYSSYVHVKAGTKVAIFLNLVAADSPFTDEQRFLVKVVNAVSWSIVYGVLGLLWGWCMRSYRRERTK